MTAISNPQLKAQLIAALDLAELRLGHAVLGPMISRNQFERITEHALETLRATAILPPDRLDELEKVLEDESCRKSFGIALNGLLHGKRGMQERFEHWIDVLKSLDIATWSMATIWPFLLFPDRFLVIDETLLTEALGGHGESFELPATLDWEGYRDSQRLAHQLKTRFGASDMLDLYLTLKCAEV
jgi:hypothetical protein